jgi:hypothetical protein
MSTVMQLKFQKTDQFSNSIFIVSNKPEDKNAFDRLTVFANILTSQNLSTFLPIYATKDYASIRFKKDDKFKFNQGSVYELEYVIRKKEHEGKEYVSCFINKSKLVKKGQTVDHGEILKLE